MAESVVTVKKVSVFGDKIILSDGSKWLISPDYAAKSAEWYETQRVVVKEIDGKLYKYQLVNLDTADIVEAQTVVS